MKGATPVGPRTSTTMSTAASDDACAHVDHRDHAACAQPLAVAGTCCATSIPTMVTTTQPLIGVGLAWKSRPRTSKALAKLVARKKTQAKHTKLNVTRRWPQRRAVPRA